MSDTTTPSALGRPTHPGLLPHPGFLQFPDQHINGLYCYINRHPGPAGVSLAVSRQPTAVTVLAGDWHGYPIDPNDRDHPLHGDFVTLLEKPLHQLVSFMSGARIPACQFYFSSRMVLVDVRTGPDKFVGPGMLADVFGRLVAVPELIKIEPLDSRALESIASGAGDYGGDLTLRPSKFRAIELQTGVWVPLQVELRR